MPVSNCEVGGGIAPVPAMLKAGIEVALGTDGYINDFFTVMKEAFLIHKANEETTEVMSAPEVFRMATEFGAKAMIYCQSVSLRELCVYDTYQAPRGATSYGVHIAKVRVDRETGAVKVLDYAAVHDVGFMSATSGVMALRRFPAAWMGFRAGCCTCFPRAL